MVPTPTVTPTAIPTVTPTVNPTVIPTVTPTVTPTSTPTVTQTSTPEPSTTPSVTPRPTDTLEQRPTYTPTVKPTDKPNKVKKRKPVELSIPTIIMWKKMGLGEKFQIKLINNKRAKVKVSSTNRKVVTVNKKGIVKAKKYGTGKVIINMTLGKQKVQYIVKVKVKKDVPFNYSLAKYNTKYKKLSICLYKLIRKGKNYKIKIKHLGKKGKVTFNSSNPKVIRVSKKGKCTALKSGKSKITIKIKKDKKVYVYFMIVRATEEGVISDTSYLKVLK